MMVYHPLKHEIARAYREYAGEIRSKTRPAPALETAVRELELAAELTAGQATQYHIDSKFAALRAVLAASRRTAR